MRTLERKTAPGGEAVPPERTARVHRQSIIVDAEAIALLLPTVHLPPPEFQGRSYLDRALASGMTAMNTTLGIGGLAVGTDDLKALLHSIYSYLVYFEMHPDKLVHVLTEADLALAKREQKLGVIFGVQGLAGKIDGDILMLRILHRLGLRIAQLTNNERNSIGCGAMEANDTGLTRFGKACVRELNRVGTLVDLAHAGEQTMLQALETSDRPCIISHANVRALTNHPRNATDAMLKALGSNRGVIGVTALAHFNQRQRGQIPTVHDMVDHIAYVADLIGVDHIGIGSDLSDAESEIRHEDFKLYYPEMVGDFPFGQTFVKNFERVDDFPNVTEALLAKGFSDEDVAKILGGNFCRVFRAAWGG